MQRIVAAALAAVCALSFTFAVRRCARTEPETPPEPEIRAVWISYIDLSAQNDADAGEDAFRAKAQTMMRRLSSFGIDTAFVHVRAFSDAFYRSDLFPFSALLTGEQGRDPGYDPLAILCEEAAAFGVRLHAWINPFRICSSEAAWEATAASNPAKLFLADDDPDNDRCVVRTAGGVYYNPASPDVQMLIVRGIQEILQRYAVDGIHIDDYFYPSQDETIDSAEYAAYRNAGGTAALDAWRRSAVSACVRAMYRAVKQYGDEKVFSISPAVNIDANRDKLYADVETWCRTEGYCDWIIPQVYVGMEHETIPFTRAVQRWNDLTATGNVTLLYGLAAYKCGKADEYAGTGSREWIENNDILARQITFCRSLPRCGGFVFYAYSSLFGENMSENAKKELQSVTSVL